MTQPQPRKRSALTEETMWSAPAVPPVPAATPAAPVMAAPPAAPPVSVATSAPEPVSGTDADKAFAEQQRRQEEARGRNRARSTVFAWAAAESKAAERLEECSDEVIAALRRGTDAEVLRGYVMEACDRHGASARRLPQVFRETLGIES